MKFNFISWKKLFLYLPIAMITYILTFIVKLADADLWARLAVGSFFFKTGTILRHDIFAYTPTKNLWIDHEWGAGVIFYSLIHYFGDLGLFALKFSLIFAIFLLLIQIVRLNDRKETVINPTMLILLAVSIFPSVVTSVRSQLFTYTFFVLWIYILERIKRNENRLIWILPVTMLIWANVHGGFLTGIGLILVYTLGESLNKKNPVRYIAALALTLPVTLINPYGVKFWNYMIEAVSMQRPHIFEWQHFTPAGPIINFFGINLHMFFGFEIIAILTLFTAIKLLINRTKIDWTKVILVVITLYLGLTHQRHIVFFVLTAFSFLYSQYISLFKVAGKIINQEARDKILNIAVKTNNFIAIFLIIFFIITTHLFSTKLYASPDFYPVGSLEFIKQNNLSGNLSIPYRWGSYALWKLYPQCLVSIDGRYEEVYQGDLFDMAADFSGSPDTNWGLYKKYQSNAVNWKQFIDKYHTDIIILPKSPLTQEKIEKLKKWKVVYFDYISMVLLPKKNAGKLFLSPDYSNPIYWNENFAKNIDLD